MRSNLPETESARREGNSLATCRRNPVRVRPSIIAFSLIDAQIFENEEKCETANRYIEGRKGGGTKER